MSPANADLQHRQIAIATSTARSAAVQCLFEKRIDMHCRKECPMYKRSAGLVFSAGVLAIVILGCSRMPDGADPSPSVLGHSSSALYSSGDCPAGSNVIVGTFGDDTIVGTNGNDCILGLDGNDIIHGGNGSDVLWGGPGNDTLYGDNGNDAIYGEEGEDVIQGNNGNDVIFGGPGSDIISGGNGNDSLDGEGGNDVITGNNGNDTLSGGYGNDMLMGSNGNDSFDGGDGLDDCAGAGVRCEPLAAPSSCSSGATCGLGQRCLPDVGVCVSCLADSDCSVACVPMIGCSAVSCPAAQPYVDVDGWYDGPYFGANGSVGGIYPVFGQSFVANANGRLAGVSFRGGRSADISQVHVSVYEFDPASGMSGANIGGRNFDVSGASLLLEDPTDEFFEICGGEMLAGRSYIATIEALNAGWVRGFFVLASHEIRPSGGMWFQESDNAVWQAFGPEDSAFRVWLFPN